MHIHEKFVDDSVIMCDEIVNMSETESTETMDKKRTYKKDYYISHIFLLAAVLLLLLAVIAIGCYYI